MEQLVAVDQSQELSRIHKKQTLAAALLSAQIVLLIVFAPLEAFGTTIPQWVPVVLSLVSTLFCLGGCLVLGHLASLPVVRLAMWGMMILSAFDWVVYVGSMILGEALQSTLWATIHSIDRFILLFFWFYGLSLVARHITDRGQRSWLSIIFLSKFLAAVPLLMAFVVRVMIAPERTAPLVVADSLTMVFNIVLYVLALCAVWQVVRAAVFRGSCPAQSVQSADLTPINRYFLAPLFVMFFVVGAAIVLSQNVDVIANL